MKIIQLFIDLCLFKANPSDVTVSQWLLKVTLLFYFVLGVAINTLDMELRVGVFTSLADVFFMLIVTGLLLKFRGFQSRYTQTVTALSGTGVCIATVGFPIMWWFYQIEPEEQATSLAMLLMIGLMFWSLMIAAHIFRQSLEIKAGTAAMITIAYTVLSIIVAGLVMSGVA